jgi:hypothetical protein
MRTVCCFCSSAELPNKTREEFGNIVPKRLPCIIQGMLLAQDICSRHSLDFPFLGAPDDIFGGDPCFKNSDFENEQYHPTPPVFY